MQTTQEALLRELAALRERVAVLEEAARVSHENESAAAFLLRAAPLGIHECDAEGRITYVNPCQERVSGYTAEELLGTWVWDRIEPGPQRDALPAYLKMLVLEQPEPTPFVGRNIRKNGEVFDVRVDWSYQRTAQGEVTGFVSIISDVTEEQRAAAALKAARDELERRVRDRTAELEKANENLTESEAKYRHLVETTDTGYLILDEAGRVVDANDEYIRISGHRTLDEIRGRSVLEWTAPHDAERNANEVRKCLQGGGVRQLEVDYAGPGGQLTPIEINAHVITTQQGRRILSLCRDISERRQAQRVLERERRTLERLFRSSDHERQLIAYDIHDGLAQYLAGAIMQFHAFDHLRNLNQEEAVQAYQEGVAMVRRSHAEARRLITGVRPPILDEAGIVAAIAHLIHEQRQPQGPKIAYHAAVEFDRLVPVQETSIYRIVQECLANACEHSKSERIQVDIVQEGDLVRIAIEDWGIGFEAARVGEDRFGLESIRERARLLGGQATIESSPGNGTRISVVMPIVQNGSAAP